MAYAYNCFHWDEGMDTSAIVAALAGTFLRLDCSNDPLTEMLELTKDFIVDTSTLVVDSVNNRVGVGTATIPVGGIGLAKLAIHNNSASPTVWEGIQFTDTTDNYPCMGIMPAGHTAGYMNFDCYYVPGSGWYSSKNLGNWQYGPQGVGTFNIRGAYGYNAGTLINDWGKCGLVGYRGLYWGIQPSGNFPDAAWHVTPGDATHIATIIEGYSGQTADLLNIQLWGGTPVLTDVNSHGAWVITTDAATSIPLILQGAASQSANLQTWQDSTPTLLAYINKTGGGAFEHIGVGKGTGTLGNGTAPATAYAVTVAENLTHATSVRGGINVSSTYAGTATGATTTIGGNFTVTYTNTNDTTGNAFGIQLVAQNNTTSGNMATIRGGSFSVAHYATSKTLTTLQGGYFYALNSAEGGTVTNMYAGYFLRTATGATGRVASITTNSYGNYITEIADSFWTGTCTNNYGLYIEPILKGTTSIGLYIGDGGTYSLQLASTDGDAASGITFGTDTNLYRSAANTLLTDDTFSAVAYKVGATAGVDMASGTPKGVVITKGIVTAATSVTPAANGTYALPTSITISGGIITAIS